MFEKLLPAPPDPILALMMEYRTDTRDDKVDLGVGVYKDADGKTPVMQAIKLAEQKLHDVQDTKTYVSPTGDLEFLDAMEQLVFRGSIDTDRVKGIQTPGGSGALKVLSDLLKAANPNTTVWVSDPTWPNHLPLLEQAGHQIARYAYYDSTQKAVAFDAMMSDLGKAKAGDIVLLHGCCHNPTGADLNDSQWRDVAALCGANGLTPFVDLAYQGFGDGLEADGHAIRVLAAELPEVVIATSCSKNMALYRERAGCAMVVAEDGQAAANTASLAVKLVRANYSMPPDHGAAIGKIVLTDSELMSIWQQELESMRLRMVGLREGFSAALRKRSNSDQFDYIATQKGMFSRLPLSQEQVTKLRVEKGIYMVGDGRFNIAGLPGHSEQALDTVASNIVAAMA